LTFGKLGALQRKIDRRNSTKLTLHEIKITLCGVKGFDEMNFVGSHIGTYVINILFETNG
jgi:hypothetical protein